MTFIMTNRWAPLLAMGVAAICIQPVAAQDSSCPSKWTCFPVTGTAPTLDAELTEWEAIDGITSSLQGALTSTKYDGGDATFKCMYDNATIYFAFEIPGVYQYNSSSDELCASIGMMTRVGVDATFFNMGGCPDAMTGCGDTEAIPDTCTDYLVDIGAHWQLPSTPEQGFTYGIGQQGVNDEGETQGVVDELAVSPYCRLEDKTSQGNNDWYGAWRHTISTPGMNGNYIFELSRPLSTASPTTDAQYVVGETYDVGVAFWDPNESADGWTDPGHYVTGCGSQWIELQLGSTTTDGGSSNGGSSNGGSSNGGSSNGGSQGGDSGAVSAGGFLLSLISIIGVALI